MDLNYEAYRETRAALSVNSDGDTQSDADHNNNNVVNMKNNTIIMRAFELIKNSKIVVRITELQAENEILHRWKREQSIAVLTAIALGEDPDGRSRNKVAAIKTLNSMHGYDAPVRSENTVTLQPLQPLSDEDFLG